MIILKEVYEDTAKRRIIATNAKEKLMNDEKVKLYLDMVEQEKKLLEEEKSLYKSMKKNEYNDCDHILVNSKIKYKKKYPFEYCGCIKCGLTDEVIDKELDSLSEEQKIMYDHLKEHHITYLSGKQLFIYCDLSLAIAICNRIKEIYPNIDDEKLINYFSIALDNMRYKDVSLTRRESRKKRLSLNPNFRDWYKEDIEVDE